MYAVHLLLLLLTLMTGTAHAGSLKACVPAHPSALFSLSNADEQ